MRGLRSLRKILPVILRLSVFSESNRFHQIYVDVRLANTSMYLESLRKVPLSTYRLSYERSGANRMRVGMIGSELARVIPDAVELVSKRTLPPLEKGGKPQTLTDVPVVNEQKLFMYGIGALQEFGKLFDKLNARLSDQKLRTAKLYGDLSELKNILEEFSDHGAGLRMRASAAEAKLEQGKMNLEIKMATDEERYVQNMKQAELEQMNRTEELLISRLRRDDEAARTRAAEIMKQKISASQIVERARSEAAEMHSKLEHDRALEVNRASEKIKEETEKKIARAKAEAERANEDVHLRRLKAEAQQRRMRNVAAIKTIFDNCSTLIVSAANHPKKVFIFVGYITLFITGIYIAREAARLCRIILESALGKPQLIRETTRQSYLKSLFTSILEIASLKFLNRRIKQAKQIEEICKREFEDLILPKALKTRIVKLAASARKSRFNDAPHRHILLYGPPGRASILGTCVLCLTLCRRRFFIEFLCQAGNADTKVS